MWNPASANLTSDFKTVKTVLHDQHIIAENFEFFWESYFTKYL